MDELLVKYLLGEATGEESRAAKNGSTVAGSISATSITSG